MQRIAIPIVQVADKGDAPELPKFSGTVRRCLHCGAHLRYTKPVKVKHCDPCLRSRWRSILEVEERTERERITKSQANQAARRRAKLKKESLA